MTTNTGQIQINVLTTLPFFFLGFLVSKDNVWKSKMCNHEEFIFPSIWRCRFRSYSTRNKFIQYIATCKFFLHCIPLFSMSEILLEHNSYLHFKLDKNMNYSIAQFILSNVLLTRNWRKKWQCRFSQNRTKQCSQVMFFTNKLTRPWWKHFYCN